jgi:hypothetical protein
MLLPDAFASALNDRATALAAAFIIAIRHPEVLAFAARMVCADAPEPHPLPRRPKAARKANGHRRPRSDDPYLGRRRARREVDDQALVEAMRRNTEATIGELATAVGKSRTSIVSAVHRCATRAWRNPLRAGGS